MKQIDQKIAKLATSEKSVKSLLSELSRDLLSYLCVDNSPDIGKVNRLLGVLTPQNKKIAALFFKAFLPFKFNENDKLFGGMLSKMGAENKRAKAREFLQDQRNDIWSWAERNVETQEKVINHAQRITNTIQTALTGRDGKDKALDQIEVIKAVLAGGISVNKLLKVAENLQKEVLQIESEIQAKETALIGASVADLAAKYNQRTDA